MHSWGPDLHPTLHALFVPQITEMHGIAVPPEECDRVGLTWRIDPRFGRGTYWFYPIDNIMAIAVCDLEFTSEAHFSVKTPDVFGFGSYGKYMASYFDVNKEYSDRTLLGYAWKSSTYSQAIEENQPLTVTSICLLPPAIWKTSLACHCDPVILTKAISSLDGTRSVLGLHTLLDEIRTARPSAVTAQAYYESKITEAVSLLVDWQLNRTDRPEPSIRPVDRTALDRVYEHIRNNLDRTITTDELCRVACMSATKLSTLFRTVEDKTPHEFIRDRRMQRACTLLAESDCTMAHVAAAIGYSRQSSFSEAFKQRYGINPHAYRILRRTS